MFYFLIFLFYFFFEQSMIDGERLAVKRERAIIVIARGPRRH